MIESTTSNSLWIASRKHHKSTTCILTHAHISHVTRLRFLSLQIPVPRTHGGPGVPEFSAAHPGGAGDGGGGSPDLERSNVPAGSDQMWLSTDIWLTPFLHVKVYHGSGSVDSPRPPGRLCGGRRPRGKSLKNNLDTCAL